MKAARNAQDPGKWTRRTDGQLWEEIAKRDSIAVVGLKSANGTTGMSRGRVLIDQAEQARARSALTALHGIKVLAVDTLLPIVTVKLGGRTQLTRLRSSPFVEYVEPSPSSMPGDDFFRSSGSGCGRGAWTAGVQYITPGDILPQNYIYMNIPAAWNKAQGAAITIGLVDTGIDEWQPQLGSQFTAGMSGGRTIVKQSTYGNPQDYCGHGTHMASVLAAPRDGQSIVGVAWKANLHSVRANENVVLAPEERDNVRNGIRTVGPTSNIIVLAGGWPDWYQSISYEIDYWHYNYDRLFIAAAGTGVPWLGVLFPARKSEVLAVTGENCGNCSYGYAVDFTAYEGQPAAANFYIGDLDPARSSGSSNASAIVAGIAALGWSRYPTSRRDGIVSSLIASASFYGGRYPDRGWGSPDAFCIVGGLCHADIEGPILIEESGDYTYTVYQNSSRGPLAYRWNTGETTQSITRYVPVTYSTPEYAFENIVTVTDLSDGTSRTVSETVFVRQPTGCPTCP